MQNVASATVAQLLNIIAKTILLEKGEVVAAEAARHSCLCWGSSHSGFLWDMLHDRAIVIYHHHNCTVRDFTREQEEKRQQSPVKKKILGAQ